MSYEDFTRTLQQLWRQKVGFNNLDIYAGIDLDSAKTAVHCVTNGLYTARAGSDEQDYLGRDSSQHVTIIAVQPEILEQVRD